MKTNKTFLFMVVLTALLVRVVFVSTLGPKLRFPDSESYATMAANLLDGKGLIVSQERKIERMPLYPLFVAGCYRLCDMLGAETENDDFNPLRILFVRLAQCFVGALTCLLVFFIGKRLFNSFAGQIAAFITAIYPFFVFYTGLLLSETLFIALLAGALLALVKLQERPSAPLAILAGVVFGAAILTRASLLLFLPFVVPFWIIGCPAKKKLAGVACLLLVWLTVCATMAPWVYRNYRLTGHVVITTLMAGPSLYEANSPGADGGPRMDKMPWDEAGDRDEYEINRYFGDKAWAYIKQELRSNPKGYLALSFAKFCRFWNPVLNNEEYSTLSNNLISISSFLPLCLLGLFGLFKSLKQPRVPLVLFSPILYYSIIHSVFVGSTRYRTPIMPFVILFAGFAIDSVLAACYRTKTSTTKGAAKVGAGRDGESAESRAGQEERAERSTAPPPSGKRRLIKKAGVVLINLLLVIVTLCCIVFTVLASPYNVKREAQKRLSEYFGAETTVESAEFSIFDGIQLNGVKVALPIENGKTEVVSIGRIGVEQNLEGPAAVKALVFDREVSIERVAIDSLEFNLNKDKQGRWNIEPILRRPAGGRGAVRMKQIPQVIVSSSTFRFRDESGKLPSFVLTDAKIDLTPTSSEAQVYDIKAAGKIAGLGKIKVKGAVHLRALGVSLDIVAKRLPIGEKLRSYLPPSGQTMWDWFKPRNGVVDFSGHLDYGNSDASSNEEKPDEQREVSYSLTLDFSDCDVIYKEFPYPLKKSRGRLQFTPGSVKIVEFTASDGKAGVKVEGELEGYGKDAGIDVMIYAHDVPFDEMLNDILCQSINGFKDVSDLYSFSDGTINVDSWHLTRDQGPNKPINHVIEVSFKGCSMNCRDFPYPIKNGEGRLRLTSSSVAIDGITASDSTGKSKITIGGRLDGFGKEAGIEITVEADNIALNDTLKNALPENIRNLWDFFNPTGSVENLTWQLRRKNGPNQRPNHFLQASLVDGTMRCNAFQYEVKEMTSSVIYENGILLLKDLKGRNGGAEIEIGSPNDKDSEAAFGDVKIDTAEDDPAFDIVIDVKNAQADERLKAALAEKFQEMWDQFKPSGTFDARCEVKRPEPGGKVNVTVNANLRGCSATYAGFAYPLTDITGEIVFRSSDFTADLKNIVGRHGGAKIALSDTTVGPPSEIGLKISGTAENLMLNDALRGALPADGREMWEMFDPKGIVDVDWEYTRSPGSENGKYKIDAKLRDVDMKYKLTETSLAPIKLMNMTGRIAFDGDNATLENVTGEFGGGPAGEQGSLDQKGAQSVVTLNGEVRSIPQGREASLKIQAERIQLSEEIKNALPADLRKKWSEMAPIAGQLSFQLNVDLEMDADAAPLDVTYDAKVALHDCALKVEIPIENLNGEIALKNGRIVNGDFMDEKSAVEGDVVLGGFTIQGIHFGRLSAKFVKKGNVLTVSKFRFGSYGGGGSGTITFTFSRKKKDGEEITEVDYSADIGVKDVQVGDIVKSANLAFKKLRGRLRGGASVAGSGLDASSLKSSGAFQITDGDISEFQKRAALPGPVTKVANFTEAEIKYEIVGDEIRAKRLNLKGPRISLYGDGRIDKKGNLQFIFRPVSEKPGIPFFDLVARLLEQTWVRVTVEGTWKDHTWKVDPIFPLTRMIRGLAGLFSSSKKQKPR